ncbi:hypothetical protein D3C87_2053980 [compost metagenome]
MACDEAAGELTAEGAQSDISDSHGNPCLLLLSRFLIQMEPVPSIEKIKKAQNRTEMPMFNSRAGFGRERWTPSLNDR